MSYYCSVCDNTVNSPHNDCPNMTTPPTPDAGSIDEPRVITALHLLRDLGFTELYDAEERPAASIADILDAWDALTAQLAAAKADGAMLADSVEDFTGAQGTAYEADQYLMLLGVLREYNARTGAR